MDPEIAGWSPRDQAAISARDVPEKVRMEAARTYGRLRRHYWPYYFGFGVLGLLPMLVLALEKEMMIPRVRRILFLPVIVNAVACWIRMMATAIALYRFRCPRCERRNIWTKWGCHRCKYCDLDLNPTTVASAKPALASDP